jgi:lipoprotein-releasing system ATP-binding protein
MRESSLASFRSREVGFVFQGFHLIEESTALYNVMLPPVLAGEKHSEAEAKAMRHLTNVGLGEIACEKVKTFSAGQKQRTALARGLVMEPAILIADEPTGNLDKENSEAVFDILKECAYSEGRAVLIATHDTGVLPDEFTDRISLEHGKIMR